MELCSSKQVRGDPPSRPGSLGKVKAPTMKDDPCIGLCQFDGRTGWCLGCGRTLREVRAWRKMTPYRRTALTRELPRRMQQVTASAAEPSRRRARAP